MGGAKSFPGYPHPFCNITIRSIRVFCWPALRQFILSAYRAAVSWLFLSTAGFRREPDLGTRRSRLEKSLTMRPLFPGYPRSWLRCAWNGTCTRQRVAWGAAGANNMPHRYSMQGLISSVFIVISQYRLTVSEKLAHNQKFPRDLVADFFYFPESESVIRWISFCIFPRFTKSRTNG